MTEVNQYNDYSQQIFSDLGMRLKDLEENQKILKDRVLLMGKNILDERESLFSQIQEMKKTILSLKEESLRVRQSLGQLTEQINKTARKEDLLILQRQFDLFRE